MLCVVCFHELSVWILRRRLSCRWLLEGVTGYPYLNL